MIGFVIPLKSEAEYLLNKVEDKKQIKLADKEAYSCKINQKDCIIAISGIGKVNAALGTQVLVSKFDVEKLVNFGVAGGLNDGTKLCQVYQIRHIVLISKDLYRFHHDN